MGLCQSCLEGSSGDHNQPSPETRRRQLAEAADKRKREDEARGVKDPEALKLKRQKREAAEKQAEENAKAGDTNLKWQVS